MSERNKYMRSETRRNHAIGKIGWTMISWIDLISNLNAVEYKMPQLRFVFSTSNTQWNDQRLLSFTKNAEFALKLTTERMRSCNEIIFSYRNSLFWCELGFDRWK